MNNLSKDIRYALRGLLRNPGFAVVAVLTIGLGIGANTTVFGWMHGLLLNPLPGATDADRVVAVENTAANGQPLTTSYPDYRNYRDNLKSYAALSLLQDTALAVGDDRNTERVWGELVSGNYFDMMGVQPEIGRFFASAESDDAQNKHAVVVISHNFWKNRYQLDRAVVGATLRVNRTPLTIIGVAPPNFHGSQSGLEFELWTPVTMYGQLTHTGTWTLEERHARYFTMFARLAPGVGIEQARGETQALANRMAVSEADADQGIGTDVRPVYKGHFTTQATMLTPVGILMGAAGVLLLIVCANVANLLLARATSRQKEFSIRLALGARPLRLIQQLLTESLMLAIAGAIAGLLLSSWMAGSLRWLMPTVSSPAISQQTMDAQVFGFTTLLAFVVALLAGLAPALSAARADINEALKEGGRSGAAGARSHRLRGLLVISEVALAVIALIGAGLFLKSFELSRTIHPGFQPAGVALARFDFSTAGYNAKQTDQFCRTLRERIEQTPGITAVSYDDSPPLGFQGGNWEGLEIEGYQPRPSENMKIFRDMVAPGYFSLMKIPLLDGRDFDLHDDAQSRKVAIINQEFAHRFFAGRNPIGHKIKGWGEWFTIVGVAQGIKYHKFTEEPAPYFYVPIRQIFRPEYGMTLHVRTSGSVAAAIGTIRREVSALDPGLTIFDAVPMTEYISAALFGQKVAASLLSVLGGLSLVLAAIGLYSVMAYSVVQRTSEIGIRVTLGAHPRDVMLMVIRQGLGFALAGLLAGSLAAAALARVLAAALVSVSPADATVYLTAALFTVAIAVLSVAIPAWRALRVDPMVALRCH
jgi:putative ABC transport system permease protein